MLTTQGGGRALRGERRFPLGVVIGSSAAAAVANIPAFLFGAFAVTIRGELGFSSAAIGIAASAFFAASALAGPVVGRVSQALGPVRALRYGTVGVAACMLAIAALADAWGVLVAFLALAGVMNSSAQTSANLAIAEHGASTRDGLSFGIKQSAAPVATMLAGLAVPVFAASIGWRWAFVAAAAVAVALAVVMPRVILGRAGGRGAAARERRRGRRAGGPVDWRILLLLAGAAFLASGSALTVSVYFVEYAVAVGWSEGAAGTVLAASSVVGLASRVSAGWFVDQRRGRGAVPESALLPAGCLMAVGAPGLLLLLAGVGWPPGVLLGAPLLLGVGWAWAGLMHYSIVSLHRGAAAVATGIVLMGVFGGGVVVPSALGVVVERHSYQAAWGIAAGMVALAALAFLAAHGILVRRARAVRRSPPTP